MTDLLEMLRKTPEMKEAGDRLALHYTLLDRTRKGTNGVGTHGAAANFMFFDRVAFWVLQFTYFYLPKSARAYLFPKAVNNHDFCSGDH